MDQLEMENASVRNDPFRSRTVALLSLAMAAVIIYMPSPLFPILSSNDLWYSFGWERKGDGTWNEIIGFMRSWLKGLNRTLLDPAFIRPFFVGCAGIIAIFSTMPWRADSKAGFKLGELYNFGLTILLIFALWILARKISLGSDTLFIPKPIDVAGAFCGVLVIVELVRRMAGWLMFAFVVLAVIYMKWGAPDWFPYQTTEKKWELLAMNFWLETTGAMGFALSIMIQNVVIFILFGVVIQATGAADAILKIAIATTQRLRGGPAHAAIVSSALFGTFSGSAAANVVGTGTFTIPLIKSRGFSPRFAGGIEAAASTGGQITPPVMGAAAFYLAEQAQIPYNQVAVAVLLPAMFYFFSLFAAVEFQARKSGIQSSNSDIESKLTRQDWIRSLSFLAPLAAIIYCLWSGFSVNRAGFWAVFMTIAFGLLNPEFRSNPGVLVEKLKQGGQAVAQLLSIVAGLGVFIGVVEGTGLGPKIGSDLALLLEEDIVMALVLTMAASLILSMGMPTLPAYATIITIMGIFVTNLASEGTPILAVHLFVLYFGVLSPVTPPVALAAYAAAPIAGAHPFKTGITAFLLCSAAFIIPYAFFFHPQLLLGQVEFEIPTFILSSTCLLLGIWILTTATTGWWLRELPVWSRILRLLVSIGLISPNPAFVSISLPIAVIQIGYGLFQNYNKATEAQES